MVSNMIFFVNFRATRHVITFQKHLDTCWTYLHSLSQRGDDGPLAVPLGRVVARVARRVDGAVRGALYPPAAHLQGGEQKLNKQLKIKQMAEK